MEDIYSTIYILNLHIFPTLFQIIIDKAKSPLLLLNNTFIKRKNRIPPFQSRKQKCNSIRHEGRLLKVIDLQKSFINQKIDKQLQL